MSRPKAARLEGMSTVGEMVDARASARFEFVTEIHLDAREKISSAVQKKGRPAVGLGDGLGWLCDQNAVIAWSHGLQRGAGGAAAAGGGVDASSCGEGWCHPLKLPNNAEPYPACICAANATGKKGGLVAVLLKTDGQGGVVSYWSDVAKGKVADTNPIRFEKEGDAPLQLLACASASCYVLVTTKGALYKITLEPFVAQRLVEPGQGGGYLAWGMSALFGGAAAQDVTIAAVVQAPVGGGSTNKLAVLTSSEVLHWVLTDGKGIKTEFIKKVMLEDANPNGEYQLLDMVAEYDDGKSLHILRRKLNTNRFSIGTANSDNDVWGDFVEVEHTFGEMPQAFADPAGKDPVRLLALAPSVLGLLDTRHGTLTMVELKGGEKGGEKEMLKQWTRYTADAEVEQLSKPNLEGIFGFAANLDGDFPYVVTGKSGGSVYRFTWGEDGVANHTVTGNTDPMQLVSDSLALLNKPLKDQDWAKAKTKGVDSVSQLRKKQLVGLRTQARDLKELLKAKVTELLPEEMPAQEWVKLERQLLKNCELISAAIGLRKHQENCAKRAVPDGNGLGDQHTRAHEIMQAAISKTVADRSEGREFGQDDSDVFYAGGKLEKIGDFLEHLIEVSGGGGGGTGRGIVDVQAVNGIIKAMLEESEKEHGEEGSEAKLLWTSEPKVRDNLMKAHKETKNIVFAPSGARAGQHALVGVLKNDLFQLGQWALDGFADIVGFGGGKADASSTGAGAAAAAAAEYIAVREEVISTFAKDDDTEEGLNRAHELAVRHKDYKTLVQLCEDFNEEEQLEKYSNDFKDDPNFAKEKFQWWFENGKRDKLLQQGDNEMDVLQLFFNEGAKVSERANIQWLHAIQIDDFGSAAKVLNSMAKAELNRTPGNVARLKTLRSLEKLSLTASDINGNGYMSENDKALRLIKAQSYLMESHPTPLPAEVVVLKLAETEPQSGSADGPESERIERSQHHASEFLFPALECWSEQCPDDISLLRKILAHAVYHDRGHLERSKVLVQESILCKTLHMYAEDANNDIPLLQRLGCSTAKEGAKALVNSEEFADIIGGGMLPGDKEELANSIQLAMEHSLEEEDAEIRTDNTHMFQETLTTCGLELGLNGPEALTATPADLCRNLVSQLDNEASTKDFLSGFDEFAHNPVCLRNCLLPLAAPAEELGNTQMSLVRVLLGVPKLQPRLVNSLLERLLEFSVDDHDDSVRSLEDDDAPDLSSMPRLILSQLRWLERIVQPIELARKMLEMAESSPIDVQREIITSLPQSIDDRATATVTEALQNMLDDQPALTVPILDALSNLSLHEDVLTTVLDQVLNALDSYEADAMPIVVKFILQSVTAPNVVDVVRRLRLNLELESLVGRQPGEQDDDESSSQRIRSSTKVGECVTLDAIKSGIRYQKITGDAWLKAIQAPKEASDQKPVDLFVLLMIYDMANQKKTVTTFIHRRVKAACITAGLIKDVFGVHGRALRNYVKPLLSISESLMRSATNGAREVASELYGQVFKHFESYEQQEVVGALVTHVGSGNPEEVDAAISLLDRLVCAHPEEMDQFYIFLKGMLDYIDNLGIHHIRILFHMLSFLITHGESLDSKSDDLHIFVRKMLTKNTLHDKRVGVIGATMMIQAIAEKSQRGGGDKGAAAAAVTSFGGSVAETVKSAAAAAVGAETGMEDGDEEGTSTAQTMNLLRLIRDQVLGDGETEAALSGSDAGNVFAAGLVYDELASTVASGNLNEELIIWIQEEITGRFQELYLADVGEALPDGFHPEITPQARFSLDDEDEGEIVVNFLLAMLEPQRGSILSMVCMCPLFRLLQKCESQASGGDLEEIDALLGCAIYAVPKSSIEGFSDLSLETKDSVCSSLFFLINWFREVVNTFAGQEDPEMQVKVLQRLENIASSEEDLRECLKLHPGFQPFPALFETDMKVSVPKRKRSKGAGSKKIVGVCDLEEDDDGDELDEGGGGGKKAKKAAKKGKATKDAVVGGDADIDDDDDDDDDVDVDVDVEDDDGGRASNASSKKKSKKKRIAASAAKSKMKKSKTSEDDDDEEDDDDDIGDDDESGGGGGGGGGSKTKKKAAKKAPQEPAALEFKPVLDMEAHLLHFRELELNVFQVLGREVVIDKLDTMNKTEVDQQTTFELPPEATLLLLRDLRRKLQRGLHPPKSTPWGTTKHSQTAGFTLLLAKDASDVASWSIEMIPRLCKLLETTISNFSGIIDDHDGMNDVSIFVGERDAPVWAETFDLLLRVFQLIISWQGFGRSDAKEAVLNSGLAAIASRLGEDDDDDDTGAEETEATVDGASTSLATRCNKAFQYFHAQGDFIPTAEVFETHLQLLGTLWNIADAEGIHNDGIATKIADACDGALKRGWSVDAKKPIKANLLQSILTAFLKYSKSPLSSVSSIVKTGMQELVESAKALASRTEDAKGGPRESGNAMSSKTFATLTKSTFPCYHRTVLASLVEIVSNGHMHESLNLLTETHFERDMEIMVNDNLGKMEHCFGNFKFLLECVRHESLQTRSVLIPTFRLGAKFVDAFQKKCMPLLEAQFRQHSSEIVALLKTVQQATRSLQRLCSHFKDEKRDEKLTSFVPALKRSLETLVFRTKAMLVNNNCRDAIIIGNLKNKDFSKGQIVSSQVPLTDAIASSEDDDDAELDAEDGEA